MKMVIRSSMIVAMVVLVLGLLSVGAGFAAELTRVKVSQTHIVGDKCIHPSSPTMGLAITAAVALSLLRILVRVATGRGYGCCRTLPNIPKLIKYCIFFAWLFSFASVGQFVAAAKLCSRKDLQLTYAGYKCYVLDPGMLSSAAICALISLGLTLFYYLVIASTQNEPIKPSAVSMPEAPAVANESQIPPTPPQMQ